MYVYVRARNEEDEEEKYGTSLTERRRAVINLRWYSRLVRNENRDRDRDEF